MGNLRHTVCICRDANLWKSQIWRLSLLHYPPSPRISMTNHPPPLTPTLLISTIRSSPYLSYGNGLGHYMKSHRRYRPSQFAVMIIFVSDEIHTKMPQKRNHESKKIQILEENGVNSTLKHRKAHNLILSGRFDPYGRPGDWCHIQES